MINVLVALQHLYVLCTESRNKVPVKCWRRTAAWKEGASTHYLFIIDQCISNAGWLARWKWSKGSLSAYVKNQYQWAVSDRDLAHWREVSFPLYLVWIEAPLSDLRRGGEQVHFCPGHRTTLKTQLQCAPWFRLPPWWPAARRELFPRLCKPPYASSGELIS